MKKNENYEKKILDTCMGDKIDYIQALKKAIEIENIEPFNHFMYAQQQKYLSNEIKKISQNIYTLPKE